MARNVGRSAGFHLAARSARSIAANAASTHIIGKTGSSQRPKNRSCMPMNSTKAIGAGASTQTRRRSSRHSSGTATAAASRGTQPSPHVNDHR